MPHTPCSPAAASAHEKTQTADRTIELWPDIDNQNVAPRLVCIAGGIAALIVLGNIPGGIFAALGAAFFLSSSNFGQYHIT